MGRTSKLQNETEPSPRHSNVSQSLNQLELQRIKKVNQSVYKSQHFTSHLTKKVSFNIPEVRFNSITKFAFATSCGFKPDTTKVN